ncbi:PilZ domain-containing protein [Pseudoalteromonas sp. G4]|uniref:PilZ domain-containing protein n=1 Tax=Pseudoalteromonas sp. G4 TaxID=2992761 RepID=UPI00237E8A52|nr:PilZ domain-containing protein [Pseudoalteromonas sp. G4]MDE3272914.1 PilZ domain-containing protein [Pseudoalteromonas sp. G4]
MAEDVLIKYQSLIEELKRDLGRPNFDAVFAKKTKTLSSSDRFLIKMEMNRLLQPINRFIDLRGQVTGEVRSYTYNGKQHFMDETAINVFEAGIRRYKRYTLAVYEAVMNTENNHKVMQRKAQERGELAPQPTTAKTKEEKPSINWVSFASYESRSEERMNYSIKVKLYLSSGSEIEASTSDISVSGCKVKLHSRYQLAKGETLRMRLVGLEQDFELGIKNGLEYEVVAVEKINADHNYVRMKRTFNNESKTIDDFLKSFIHGNKRRYKVNLDNTLDAVIVKGYEQYYLPRVSSLFLFLSVKDARVSPSLVLTNENNLNVARFFNDENRNSVLPQVLNPARINQLIKSPGDVKQLNLFCFTHTNSGKLFFYSASEQELNNTPNLRNLFWGFASQKPSFRIFNVQLMPCSSEDSYIPLSLPDSASSEIAKLNKPPSPRVQGIVKDAKYLALITDITSTSSTEQFKQITFDKSHVNHLKQYGHQKLRSYPSLEFVALDYINLRNETRYLYKTPIQLEQEEKGNLTGHTLDFSINGLQLELASPTNYEKGDLLLVAFPELQKLTKKFQLNKLPYEVMAVSKTKTIVNLRSYKPSSDTEHQGVRFFNQLIANNKSKLVASEESPKTPGLSTALRNMVTKNVCQFPFYLHKRGSQIKVGAIAKGVYPNTCHLLLSHIAGLNKQFEFKQLIKHDDFENMIALPLKEMARHDAPLQFDLYVRLQPKERDADKAFITELLDFKALNDRSNFVKASVAEELFFAFRLYISRTGRPDTDYIAKELSYISQYAQHKAKDLEEELWSVIGVGDAVDITQEVLTRYGVSADVQESLNKRKALWSKTAQYQLSNLFE